MEILIDNLLENPSHQRGKTTIKQSLYEALFISFSYEKNYNIGGFFKTPTPLWD